MGPHSHRRLPRPTSQLTKPPNHTPTPPRTAPGDVEAVQKLPGALPWQFLCRLDIVVKGRGPRRAKRGHQAEFRPCNQRPPDNHLRTNLNPQQIMQILPMHPRNRLQQIRMPQQSTSSQIPPIRQHQPPKLSPQFTPRLSPPRPGPRIHRRHHSHHSINRKKSQSRICQQTGSPADDNLINPGPPPLMLSHLVIRLTPGPPVQNSGPTRPGDGHELSVDDGRIPQMRSDGYGLPSLKLGEGDGEPIRHRSRIGPRQPVRASRDHRRQGGRRTGHETTPKARRAPSVERVMQGGSAAPGRS